MITKQHRAMFAKLKRGDAVVAFGQRGFLVDKKEDFGSVRLFDHEGHNGHDQIVTPENIKPHPSGSKMRVTEGENEYAFRPSYLYKHRIPKWEQAEKLRNRDSFNKSKKS